MVDGADDRALDAVAEQAWALAVRGAADRRSPLRTPVLATVAETGGPEARVVVLRAVAPALRRFTVFTDGRSAKCAQLTAGATLCFWDPKAQIQMRFSGTAILHDAGPVHAAAWSRIAARAGRDYGAEPPPGAPLEGPDAWTPTDDAASGAAAFRVLEVTATHLDWLWLRPEGHRRARFEWSDEATPSRAHWVTP